MYNNFIRLNLSECAESILSGSGYPEIDNKQKCADANIVVIIMKKMNKINLKIHLEKKYRKINPFVMDLSNSYTILVRMHIKTRRK